VKAVLLTGGDPDALTGGSLFHRRVAERAPAFGVEVEVRAAGRRGHDVPDDAGVVVVDSLVARLVRPRNLSRPIVASVHQRPGGPAGPWAARAVRAVPDLRLYRRAAAVVVPSAFLRGALVRAGVPGQIVHVVEPGSDRTVGGGSMQQRVGEWSRSTRFITVANLSGHKRPFDLIEAFARLRDVDASLRIVGGAPDRRLADRIRARLAEPDLLGRAAWIGPLPPTALADALSAADVFVLPALDESYGMAVAEAMRAGVPPIVAASGNLPNLVRPGIDGLVVPARDVAALADAMRGLALDSSRRAAMGAAARMTAERRPSWDAAAEAFCRVVTSVQSSGGLASGRRWAK
jgi:glycosyltransferase involved in cell wall biosynthesis